ncbi:pectate lyase [Mariniflexile litorale]|uniref:Pectate lyase n=1 Tax=Mariniflexile litorale TaxID=3045158 RepID=A0AAU7EDW5_9FLAO|nr:pectate lyase [Mariniflexile sp. KMM 9835]MDQ8211740.1 pectate lyase [Mariniflexile sp. KMM 9835]
MKIEKLISTIVLTLTISLAFAQDINEKHSTKINKKWSHVATKMPTEWYGSKEAKLIAENVLLAQKEIGGWEKNTAYHLEFSESEKAKYLLKKKEKGGTFDNGATITELKFLAKVYSNSKDERYKEAFIKGVNYIFKAQYKNGGWPQFFPVKDAADEIALDNTEPYSMHITYNDDAMVNTMQFLKNIFTSNKEFNTLKLDDNIKLKAKNAFNMGIECILNTQIIVDNQPTIWCAQHNENTLAPANARSYELASFSGSESVGILLLLMDIEKPSKKIIASINGAIKWFETHKIEGIKIETETQVDGKRNRIVVKDENAPILWARFYDLETEKPYFCDRDGIKKNSLAEIGHNRRNGYSWYTNRPEEALKKHKEWLWKRICYSDLLDYFIVN